MFDGIILLCETEIGVDAAFTEYSRYGRYVGR